MNKDKKRVPKKYRNDTKRLVKEQLVLTILLKAFETERDAEFFDLERISLPNGKVEFTYIPKPHTQQMLDDAFNRIFPPRKKPSLMEQFRHFFNESRNAGIWAISDDIRGGPITIRYFDGRKVYIPDVLSWSGLFDKLKEMHPR